MEVRVLPPQPLEEGKIAMAETLKINKRLAAGSGEARRLRKKGLIPAIIYGKGAELQISTDEREFLNKIGYSAGSGIINLDLKGKTETTIVKDIQWDALTDRPVHVDFLRVALDDIVSVPIPVHLENSPVGVLVEGGVLDHHLHEIVIRVKASEIPHFITVDVAKLEIGDSLHVRDLELPEGMEFETSEDVVVASVLPPTIIKTAELEEEVAEVEGEIAEEEVKTGEEEKE